MDSAKRYFAEHGIRKIPSYKILQSEIEKLTSWQNELYEELKEKRSEVKRLQIITDNLNLTLHEESNKPKKIKKFKENNMNNYDPIDLCECYESLDFSPKEILQAWKRENEPVPEPFYGTELDGEKFFYIGNTRINVSEHFNKDGKPLEDLIEEVIKYSVKSSF